MDLTTQESPHKKPNSLKVERSFELDLSLVAFVAERVRGRQVLVVGPLAVEALKELQAQAALVVGVDNHTGTMETAFDVVVCMCESFSEVDALISQYQASATPDALWSFVLAPPKASKAAEALQGVRDSFFQACRKTFAHVVLGTQTPVNVHALVCADFLGEETSVTYDDTYLSEKELWPQRFIALCSARPFFVEDPYLLIAIPKKAAAEASVESVQASAAALWSLETKLFERSRQTKQLKEELVRRERLLRDVAEHLRQVQEEAVSRSVDARREKHVARWADWGVQGQSARSSSLLPTMTSASPPAMESAIEHVPETRAADVKSMEQESIELALQKRIKEEQSSSRVLLGEIRSILTLIEDSVDQLVTSAGGRIQGDPSTADSRWLITLDDKPISSVPPAPLRAPEPYSNTAAQEEEKELLRRQNEELQRKVEDQDILMQSLVAQTQEREERVRYLEQQLTEREEAEKPELEPFKQRTKTLEAELYRVQTVVLRVREGLAPLLDKSGGLRNTEAGRRLRDFLYDLYSV